MMVVMMITTDGGDDGGGVDDAAYGDDGDYADGDGRGGDDHVFRKIACVHL